MKCSDREPLSEALATDISVCIGLPDALATVLDVFEVLHKGQRSDFRVYKPLPDALATFPTIVEDKSEPKNYLFINNKDKPLPKKLSSRKPRR